jgi:hypothetical protein
LRYITDVSRVLLDNSELTEIRVGDGAVGIITVLAII